MSRYSKKRSASTVEDEDDNGPPVAPKAAKKSKKVASTGAPDGKDDEGNPFWELSNKRRVGVSQFKNLWMVNVREYYEKDGKMLPGKKGISLSIEQYTALLKAVPSINATLREMGQAVDGIDETDETAVATTVKPKKEKSRPSKANIEATSDEDEG
ncbi:putative RNA polymerase II transcriptional coactivator [Tolypocladium ophioglossoides CBS 100239]|uniref:Putative RNA polymerase II transcriptional coactivator n=1 Tax=Tolypocladium ophioglossoides (strain CBS 100239) TaxID=1163406 RepID=A0A0L0N6P0_TOLOC|nr:putative RNA polymerase II transcriptional coactivator [Tolypocladium ophioglossoides CBS 100239]